MTKTKRSTARASAKKDRREHLHIEVHQRCDPGLRPGRIRVFKKVLASAEVGLTVKQARAPVLIDHTLPAGTAALTAADKQAFTQQGLTASEIAYIEDKLPEKKLKSDAHQAEFEADEPLRLRKKLTKRLVTLTCVRNL